MEEEKKTIWCSEDEGEGGNDRVRSLARRSHVCVQHTHTLYVPNGIYHSRYKQKPVSPVKASVLAHQKRRPLPSFLSIPFFVASHFRCDDGRKRKASQEDDKERTPEGDGKVAKRDKNSAKFAGENIPRRRNFCTLHPASVTKLFLSPKVKAFSAQLC